jgi:DNA-binding NarL/FixJ family response regulator
VGQRSEGRGGRRSSPVDHDTDTDTADPGGGSCTGQQPRPARPRVAVANEFELIVAGLAGMLSPFADRLELADAIVIDQPIAGEVDIALYDIFTRAAPVGPALRQLLNKKGVRRAVVYSFEVREEAVREAIDAGASGYLSKATPAEELVAQLERIAGGEVVVAMPPVPGPEPIRMRTWPGRNAGLSEREGEVVALAAVGHRNAEIAEALFISVDTVKTHLSRAFRKLGLTNRTQLASFALHDDSFREWSHA